MSLLAIVAVSVVLYYIRFAPSTDLWTLLPFGLLLGGILGNFVERVYHQHVTDFLELHWREQVSWPTFNIADAAITCGVLVLLYQTLFAKELEADGEDRLAGADEG